MFTKRCLAIAGSWNAFDLAHGEQKQANSAKIANAEKLAWQVAERWADFKLSRKLDNGGSWQRCIFEISLGKNKESMIEEATSQILKNQNNLKNDLDLTKW